MLPRSTGSRPNPEAAEMSEKETLVVFVLIIQGAIVSFLGGYVLARFHWREAERIVKQCMDKVIRKGLESDE